jgi:hypothetical protein
MIDQIDESEAHQKFKNRKLKHTIYENKITPMGTYRGGSHYFLVLQ